MSKCQQIVGILTFIGMINTTSESLKAISHIISILDFYDLKFHAQFS